MTSDLKVLIAAFRTDNPYHTTAYAWLTRARRNGTRGDESLTLLPMITAGFHRLVTIRGCSLSRIE